MVKAIYDKHFVEFVSIYEYRFVAIYKILPYKGILKELTGISLDLPLHRKMD